jgi:hypothetical protein
MFVFAPRSRAAWPAALTMDNLSRKIARVVFWVDVFNTLPIKKLEMTAKTVRAINNSDRVNPPFLTMGSAALSKKRK